MRSDMNHKLATLLNRPDIWQASAANSQVHSLATGYPQLDHSLHHKGWPLGAITELLGSHKGTGEMHLLMPALARISQQNRWIVLVSPPCLPYATSLQQQGLSLHRILLLQPRNPVDQLWAIEQVLRSGSSGALLSWLHTSAVTHTGLRKLQLAAQAGGNLAVLFRPDRAAHQPSPAALRIACATTPETCHLRILKQRGGWSGQTLHIPKPDILTREAIPNHQLPVHKPETTEATSPVTVSLPGIAHPSRASGIPRTS